LSPKGLWARKRRPDVDCRLQIIQSFLARAIRLYEKEPGEPFDSSRLGVYVQRWVGWVNAGIREDGMVLVLRDTGVLPVFPAHPKEA